MKFLPPLALFVSTLVPLLGCESSPAAASAGGTGTSSAAGTGSGSSTGSGGGDASAPDAGPCMAAGPVVVTMQTDDGITLEADLYTTGKTAGPSVVLLHMIPPANDRKNYPPSFISALVARGLTVLNVDRRGAGGSGGVAKDAYVGTHGKLDAKAAVSFLRAHACAADPARIALVGASNGTTTALDYSVSVEGDPTAKAPRALVFLTGGAYTENQSTIAQHRLLLDAVPLLFVYSKAESAWSEQFVFGAPPTWAFKEYDPGAHGTHMFEAQPKAIDDVADFLAKSVP